MCSVGRSPGAAVHSKKKSVNVQADQAHLGSLLFSSLEKPRHAVHACSSLDEL